MSSVPRFIAVGDVHGELGRLQEILAAEVLIDPYQHWSGRNSCLLQIGDVIDRGPDSLEADSFLRSIQEGAEQAGGKVIRLLGNHELLILQGAYYLCNFRNPEILARTLKIDVISGKIQAAFSWENRLYVHAGLRQRILEFVGKEMKIEAESWDPYYGVLASHLNQILREAVKREDYSHPIFWADRSRGGEDPVGGIFWSHYPDLELEEDNAARQVVGHTPARIRNAKIHWTPDKMKINIDAGMYRGYGGNLAWLVVESGHLYAKQLLKGKIVQETIE